MITVLCVQKDSHYRNIPGCDYYGIDRNAYNFKGSNVVIAHPPCGQWGKLKGLALYNESEKNLAPFCLEKIRSNGGILEHPASSSFIKSIGQYYNKLDPFGGFLLSVNLSWFGFSAQKKTCLYIVGLTPKEVSFPIALDMTINNVEKMSYLQRAKTPLAMVEWLYNNALRIEKKIKAGAFVPGCKIGLSFQVEKSFADLAQKLPYRSVSKNSAQTGIHISGSKLAQLSLFNTGINKKKRK